MADVRIERLSGYGLAHVLPLRGKVAANLGAGLGFVPAEGARASGDAALGLWSTAPGQWLAFAPAAAPGWIEDLATRLDGMAHVVEQTGGYTVFALAGADARRLLQKGLPVDLSPATFAPGAIAVSVIGHIGVIVHAAAPDLFHVAVFRSFTAAFQHWLEVSAAAL